MQISVTVGRNIGTDPMPDARWANFQWCVVDQLFLSPAPTYTRQTGEWEGVAEESVTFTGEVTCWDTERWAWIARAFSQDAIAVLLPGAGHWLLVKADGSAELGWEVS